MKYCYFIGYNNNVVLMQLLFSFERLNYVSNTPELIQQRIFLKENKMLFFFVYHV